MIKGLELKFFLLTFLVIISFSTAEAKEIIGQGYGKTEKEAKKEALGDLSSAIQAEVKSDFKSIVSVFGKGQRESIEEVSKKITQVKSELPILGAEFHISTTKHDVQASAVLDSNKVLVLYEEKLKELKKETEAYLKILNDPKNESNKYSILSDLLTLIDLYYKYKTVAVMLGNHNIALLSVTEAEVKEKLRRLENNVSSLELAAELITKGMDYSNIYIFPPKMKDSHEVTQFASAVKSRIENRLSTVASPKMADFIMTGTYEITNDGIELTYRLSNRDFNTLLTKVIKLSPKSYASYKVKPKSISFDKLLYEGYVTSSDFRAELSTNIGREGLLFKKGEEIELFIKMNQPGYLYMVGHVNKNAETYSYLVELQEGDGNRKFVYFVNADDANRWISLGKFNAVPPFGVENIQMIASTKDLVDMVPSSNYDKKMELYIVSKDPEKGVVKTRALKKKTSKKAKSIEDVLTFTTMKN